MDPNVLEIEVNDKQQQESLVAETSSSSSELLKTLLAKWERYASLQLGLFVCSGMVEA